MRDAKVIYRCCGTCRYWVQGYWVQDGKNSKKGRCWLSGKVRKYNDTKGHGDTKGCLGWKQAELEEIESRGL